jgi:pimeloyl-ACP methyl ester carboxylesterase
MMVADRDGVAISYEVHGKATDTVPLLLSHGFGASSAMWAPNLAALSRDRLVITWDLRGHGRSASPDDPAQYSQAASVADMSAILDACGVERAAIGGLSLGGFLSLAFYLVHPGRVSALLLFDTGPGYKDDAARQRWNNWAVARAEAFDSDGLAALGASPEVRRGHHDPRGLASAARGILTQQTSQVIDSLSEIRVPTLVLVGSDDRPFLNAADYMAIKIPAASKIVIGSAGHASNIDQPEVFNTAVLAFLDTMGPLGSERRTPPD